MDSLVSESLQRLRALDDEMLLERGLDDSKNDYIVYDMEPINNLLILSSQSISMCVYLFNILWNRDYGVYVQ